MGATPMQLHKDAVTSAEVTRQNAMAAPGLTAAAAKAADVAFHQAAVVSAMANSISPVASLTALRSLGASPPSLPSVTPHGEVSHLPRLPVLPVEKPEAPPGAKPEPVVAASAEPAGAPIGYADEEAENEEDDARAASKRKAPPTPPHRR
jgi:hypothetical protein